MAAVEILLSENIEAELQPHVVIIANDTERFASYKSTLDNGGFPCELSRQIPNSQIRAGTVFFLSFNLKSDDAAAAARRIENTLRLNCIVFAEEEGTQTATKLSSAKMSQTLQFPYTEKNFLMAMQTIVKKRKAQFEKEQRKKQHEERMRSRQQGVAKETLDLGVIIQQAPEALVTTATQVFKGEHHTQFTLTQKTATARDFNFTQEGSPRAPSSSTTAPINDGHPRGRVDSSTETTTQTLEITATNDDADPTKESTPRRDRPIDPALPVAPVDTVKISTVRALFERERTMNEFWVVLAMCLIGSAVCLFCVYQILIDGF